eukprot:GHRR01007468.1.p1 GENE.GHRR01007468.1~~GHRR01007468.1.p1  ORF type:complete len:279 (+),score=83.80 GHRR01007468.1:163-999(+)
MLSQVLPRSSCKLQLPAVRCSAVGHIRPAWMRSSSRVASSSGRARATSESQAIDQLEQLPSTFMVSFGLYLLSEAPALADTASGPFQGMTANSLYVTLGLFLLTAPGIWSQIKRAPQAVKKRITFEVPGPAVPGSMPLDTRARQVFAYFKRYNYQIKETGEVITFEGIYAADRGQAAAVTFYTFAGIGSISLVLSILVPSVGNWWYLLTLLSPAAWVYYFQKGERTEQVRVKMVTSDDETVTDITVEGDREEIERMSKELDLVEKGKVRVKGILEEAK